jgi:hypothetical protein
MGKDDVYEFLCKHRGTWYSNKVIAKKLKINICSATRSTAGLFDEGLVAHRKIPYSSNGYEFCVEIENISVALLLVQLFCILAIAWGAYHIGSHYNLDKVRASFDEQVGLIDDSVVDNIVANCSSFPRNEDQVDCVQAFIDLINASGHEGAFLSPSQLMASGGVCRDVAVMQAAIFKKLGWSYSFSFPLRKHVFTTIATTAVCDKPGLVDCAIYCNVDWGTYACYRMGNEKTS